MELYSRLHNKSKKIFVAAAAKWPRHEYNPSGLLLVRLARETGMSESDCYLELIRELKEMHQENHQENQR